MTAYANTFEGGTNGTTITTGNSGGGSGNAWDTATPGTGATLAYDNAHAAHGTLAGKVATGATAATVLISKTFPGATTTPALRFYCYFTANPGSILEIAQCRSGATVRLHVLITTTGKVRLTNAAGSTVFTSTNSINLNGWSRVEVYGVTLDAVTGAATIALFNSPDSSTATESSSFTSQNFGGSADRVSYGVLTNSTANVGPFWFDDVAENDTGTAIGPAGGTAATATASLDITASGGGSAPATATASLSLVASGAATAPATATAAVSLTASGTAAALATGTAALDVTATGAASTPATATATVDLTATGTAQAPAAATAAVDLTASGTATAQPSGTAAIDITAAGTATASPSGTAALDLVAAGGASAPVTATANIDITALGQAAVQAASTALISLIAQGAAHVTAVFVYGHTPPERTLHVEAENRVLRIRREDRTLHVPAENRVQEVRP